MKEINKKLKSLLEKNKKSTYGLSKFLGITPQGAEAIVKKEKLKEKYERLQKIAEYAGADNIEDIIDD